MAREFQLRFDIWSWHRLIEMNLPTYVPTEDDIFYRKVAQSWMVEQGWDKRLIDSIFFLDTPSIKIVERLVYRRGPEYAYQVLKRMVIEE